MTGLICKCGGNLHRTVLEGEYEEYICDACERTWFRCEVCNGALHAYHDGKLELEIQQ